MISLNINNSVKENLYISEGKQEGMVCIQINDQVVALNAAQAAGVVNFLVLLLDNKEQNEAGEYPWLREKRDAGVTA